MVKEYNLNLIKRSITGLIISVPLVLMVLAQNYCLFGSNIGRTPIAPNISPNKTLEGLLGGIFAVLIYALLICYFSNLKYWLVPICILGGLLAFFGDLLISLHKREKGIKDTGSFLPGHGGILDRIDSHLLATPIMLFISIISESI